MADLNGIVLKIVNSNEYEVAESIIVSMNTLMMSEKADPSPTTWADITQVTYQECKKYGIKTYYQKKSTMIIRMRYKGKK